MRNLLYTNSDSEIKTKYNDFIYNNPDIKICYKDDFSSNVSNKDPKLKYKVKLEIATSEQKKNLAYRIRYFAYLDRGFIPKSKINILKDKYDDTSLVLLLAYRNFYIGTIRICESNYSENFKNVPCSKIYQDKLKEVFSNKTIIEATKMAITNEYNKNTLFFTLLFMNVAYQYAKVRNIDNIVIAVSRRHLSLYKDIGLAPISEEKKYPGLNLYTTLVSADISNPEEEKNLQCNILYLLRRLYKLL